MRVTWSVSGLIGLAGRCAQPDARTRCAHAWGKPVVDLSVATPRCQHASVVNLAGMRHETPNNTDHDGTARRTTTTPAMRRVAAALAAVRPGLCVTHDHLLAVSAPPRARFDRRAKIVTVYVCRLRRYMHTFGGQGRIIHSHFGIGYSLEPGYRALLKWIAEGEPGGRDAAPTVGRG